MSRSRKTKAIAKTEPRNLQELLVRETQKREEACLAEVNAALKRHNCILVGQAVITGDRVSTGVIVKAAPVQG